jgi:hypothetical protein
MELKQSPFSLYDFLGYFVPGAALIYLLGPASRLAGLKGVSSSLASFSSVSDFLPFLICAYVLGQLNALCSSILIERFAIWRFGYPSKHLLNIESDGYWQFAGYLNGVLGGLAVLPIVLGDFVFGRLLGLSRLYCQSLDPLLIVIIKSRIDVVIASISDEVRNKVGSFSASSTDFFRIAYHFSVEHSIAHLPKMQNYVALFGFYRSFALISVLSFWYLMVSMAMVGIRPSLTFMAFLSILSSYLFFVGFLKFYRRFCLEALMAVTVTGIKNQRYHRAIVCRAYGLIKIAYLAG